MKSVKLRIKSLTKIYASGEKDDKTLLASKNKGAHITVKLPQYGKT